MSSPLIVVVAVALAAAILVLLSRKNQTGRGLVPHGTKSDADRDYPKEREAARVAHMSAEDRAWEAASQQRNHVLTERADALAEPRL